AKRAGAGPLNDRLIVPHIKSQHEAEQGQSGISKDKREFDQRYDPTRRAGGLANRRSSGGKVFDQSLSFHRARISRILNLRPLSSMPTGARKILKTEVLSAPLRLPLRPS